MKSNPFYLLISLIFFLAQGQDVFGNVKEELKNAAALFRDERYEDALQIWQLLASQHASGNLYYNIGLAEAKLNHVPQAIYAFEQALRFHPGNPDYHKALEKERKKLDDAIVPIQPFFLSRWTEIFLSTFRPGTWVFTGLLIGLIALVFTIPDIRDRISQSKYLHPRMLLWLAIIGAVLVVIGALSFQRLYNRSEAVLMDRCEIRQAASAESPPLRNLSAGEKVVIKDELGEWVYVSLLNMDYGWIKKECLQTIRID